MLICADLQIKWEAILAEPSIVSQTKPKQITDLSVLSITSHAFQKPVTSPYDDVGFLVTFVALLFFTSWIVPSQDKRGSETKVLAGTRS